MSTKKKSDAAGSKDKDVLKRAARSAVNKIVKLAEDSETDTKVKLDAYKWLCEMYFGKPQSVQKSDGDGDKVLHLSFEGELDKWSD